VFSNKTLKDTARHTGENRSKKEHGKQESTLDTVPLLLLKGFVFPKFFDDSLIFQLLPYIILLIVLPMILQFPLASLPYY